MNRSRARESEVTNPDQFRDYGWDDGNIQAQMLYELALQVERIADAVEDDDE